MTLLPALKHACETIYRHPSMHRREAAEKSWITCCCDMYWLMCSLIDTDTKLQHCKQHVVRLLAALLRGGRCRPNHHVKGIDLLSLRIVQGSIPDNGHASDSGRLEGSAEGAVLGVMRPQGLPHRGIDTRHLAWWILQHIDRKTSEVYLCLP